MTALKRTTSVVVVAALIGAVAWLVWPSSSPAPKLTAPAPACLASPAAAIAADAAHGVPWNGGGQCYTVANGIEAVGTVENATFNDPTNTPPLKGSVKPVIDVRANNVTLSNLSITGGATDKKLHPGMVNQSAIRVENAANVTITGIRVQSVFGDGLELWTQVHNSTPSSNVTVNGLDVISAGRDGITPGDVTNSTFSNIQVGPTGQAAIDFESDIAGVGAGNVTFTNCSWPGGVVIGEALTGPVTFTNSNFAGQLLMRYATPQTANVTFTHDVIALPANKTGVVLRRGVATLSADLFSRQAGNKTSPASLMWDVEEGSHLTVNGGTNLVPQPGYADATSTAVVSP